MTFTTASELAPDPIERSAKHNEEFQRLCDQVRKQQEIVHDLGGKFLQLVTERRWESAQTVEEITMAKLECSEASDRHLEEEELLEALKYALKFNFPNGRQKDRT
jgi:hypothetical protein